MLKRPTSTTITHKTVSPSESDCHARHEHVMRGGCRVGWGGECEWGNGQARTHHGAAVVSRFCKREPGHMSRP